MSKYNHAYMFRQHLKGWQMNHDPVVAEFLVETIFAKTIENSMILNIRKEPSRWVGTPWLTLLCSGAPHCPEAWTQCLLPVNTGQSTFSFCIRDIWDLLRFYTWWIYPAFRRSRILCRISLVAQWWNQHNFKFSAMLKRQIQSVINLHQIIINFLFTFFKTNVF